MPSPQSRVVRSPFGETLESRALTFVALKIVDIFQRRETLIGEPRRARSAQASPKRRRPNSMELFRKARPIGFPQAEEDVASVERPAITMSVLARAASASLR